MSSSFLNNSRGFNRDLKAEIPLGLVSGVSHIAKFGRNPDIDTTTDPEDIWDAGGLWVPPTLPRIHDIKSSVANDVGILRASGTATSGSINSLIDTGATFITSLVAVGDVVLNDTTKEEVVITALTETAITFLPGDDIGFKAGDTYRIVNASNTGASVVHIMGLDANMKEQSELVIVNGITNVPTVNTYYRIYRMHIDGAASRTVSNVGIISATAQTDGTVTAQINAGNGQTLMAIYTIPMGKIGLMTGFYASIKRIAGTAGAMANLSLMMTRFASVDGTGSRLQHHFGIAVDGASYIQHQFNPYKRINENTDIWIRCESVTDNNTDISAGFNIILIDK